MFQIAYGQWPMGVAALDTHAIEQSLQQETRYCKCPVMFCSVLWLCLIRCREMNNVHTSTSGTVQKAAMRVYNCKQWLLFPAPIQPQLVDIGCMFAPEHGFCECR